MTVLTNIPNGASLKDIRDTINKMLGDIVVLQQGATIPPASPTMAFSSADISVPEGNAGTSAVPNTITVNRNGVTGALVVNLSASGSATSGTDYVALPSTVTVPAGADSVSFDLLVNGNTTPAPDKTVIINAALAAYSSVTTSRTVTILNDDASETPATFAMAQLPTANRIYPRTTGGNSTGGTGSIPVTANVTGAGALYARIRSVDGSNTILQAAWKAVASAPVGNGAVTITGIEARVAQFFVDLAGSATGPWQLGTTPVGMGRLVLMTGQSLQVRNFLKTADNTTIADAGVTVTDSGRVIAVGETTTNGGWLLPSDAGPVTSAAAADLINRQSALFGCRIGLVFSANGGSSLSQWQPGGTFANDTIAILNAVGNRIEAHWQYQGHSDTGRSYRAIWNDLKGWMGVVNGALTGPAPARYFTAIPNINATAFGPEFKRTTVRSVYEDYARVFGGTYLCMNDIAMVAGEGIHAIQIGAVRQVVHFHRSTRVERGLPGDRGAIYGVPVVSGLTVTLPYTPIAGAGAPVVVGDPKSRFAVRKRGSNDPIAINTMTVNASSLVFDLASAPGSKVEVQPFFTSPDDGTQNMIYAGLTDGDGIPVGRQLFAPARSILSRPKQALTLAGGTEAYAASKFGQGRSNGWLQGPQGTLPSIYAGFILELWLLITSIGNGLQIIYQVNSIGGYLQQNGATLSFADLTGSEVTVVVGQYYHVAVAVDPGGQFFTFFVNGVRMGAPKFIADNPGLDSPFHLGALGNGAYGYTSGVIDEVAMWMGGSRYREDTYVVPTAPYVGNEDDMLHLWHLNGDLTDSCTLNT